MSMTIFNKMMNLTIECQDRAEQINILNLYIYFNALSTDYHVCGSIVSDCNEFLDCLVEEDMVVLGKSHRKIEQPNWEKFQYLMTGSHHKIPQWIHDVAEGKLVIKDEL